MRFQEVIQFVAGFAFGAAGAPDLSIKRDHTYFAGRLFTRAAANTDGSINQWQLVVFLKKNHHSIGQLHPTRLLRLELVQGRNGDLLPGSGDPTGWFGG